MKLLVASILVLASAQVSALSLKISCESSIASGRQLNVLIFEGADSQNMLVELRQDSVGTVRVVDQLAVSNEVFAAPKTAFQAVATGPNTKRLSIVWNSKYTKGIGTYRKGNSIIAEELVCTR